MNTISAIELFNTQNFSDFLKQNHPTYYDELTKFIKFCADYYFKTQNSNSNNTNLPCYKPTINSIFSFFYFDYVYDNNSNITLAHYTNIEDSHYAAIALLSEIATITNETANTTLYLPPFVTSIGSTNLPKSKTYIQGLWDKGYSPSNTKHGFTKHFKVTWSAIYIPASVKTIGVYAFRNLRNLTQVIFEDCDVYTRESPLKVYSGAFSDCRKLTEICMPDNTSYVVTSNFKEPIFPDCTKVSIHKKSVITLIDTFIFEQSNNSYQPVTDQMHLNPEVFPTYIGKNITLLE